MIKRILFVVLFLISYGAQAINYKFVDDTTTTCLDTLFPVQTPATTTSIWSGVADNDVSGSINIPFSFPFNGTSYSTLTVGVNGVIFLGWAGGAAANSTTIPTSSFTGPTLFPFWADLYKDNSSSITYGVSGTAPNRVFVIQYNAIENYYKQTPAAANTFQVQLWEGGDIVYRYMSIQDPGTRWSAGSAIGLQTSNSSGVQYSYHTDSIAYNRIILFRPTTATMPVNGACSTSASNFNTFESSTTSNFNTGRIYTKLAGTAFTLKVAALTSTGSVLTNYNGSVTASLVDWSGASPSCATAPLISGTSNAINFVTTDAGIRLSTWNVGNSYPVVKVKMVDTTNNVTSCSSDSFSIRPASFTLSSTKAVLAGNVAPTYATTVKSGNAFDLSYTAMSSTGAVTTNYTGTPVIDNSALTPHTGAVATGAVSGTLSPGVNGTSTSNISYTEVGFVNLGAGTLLDTTYTATDSSTDCVANSYSNTLNASGQYGCLIANANAMWVGRFRPDHFDLTGISLSPRNDYPTCSGIYNYVGEDIGWSFNVLARNSSGATTQNYTGDYNTLNLNTTATYTLKAKASTVLATSVSAASGSITNGAGTANLSGRIVRGAPTNEYTADWGVSLVDADGSSTIPDVDLDTTPGNDSRLLTSGLPHRYGLLKISSVVGNNNTQVRVPFHILYRNSNGWRVATDDLCTAFTNSNVVLGNLSGISNTNVVITSISSINNGTGYINLKSTATNQASFEIGFQNGTAPAMCPSFTQSNTSNSSSKTYLYSNSCGTNFDKDPRARVSVGIASKNNPVIYWQEKY